MAEEGRKEGRREVGGRITESERRKGCRRWREEEEGRSHDMWGKGEEEWQKKEESREAGD
jgi:hypothetical protein